MWGENVHQEDWSWLVNITRILWKTKSPNNNRISICNVPPTLTQSSVKKNYSQVPLFSLSLDITLNFILKGRDWRLKRVLGLLALSLPKMVQIHVNQAHDNQFLYNCPCTSTIDETAREIIQIYNLQAKIHHLVPKVEERLLSESKGNMLPHPTTYSTLFNSSYWSIFRFYNLGMLSFFQFVRVLDRGLMGFTDIYVTMKGMAVLYFVVLYVSI